jgi:predicted transcriptional regulator
MMEEVEMFHDILRGLSPLGRNILGILKSGRKERRELVEILDQPRTTIYDNIQRLINNGLVKKYSEPLGGRGRPTVYYQLRMLPEFMMKEIAKLGEN